MKYAIYGDANSNGVAAFAPRQARAYCDGRKANVDGALIDTNPFNPANEFENSEAWNFGWTAASLGETASQTYCAV